MNFKFILSVSLFFLSFSAQAAYESWGTCASETLSQAKVIFKQDAETKKLSDVKTTSGYEGHSFDAILQVIEVIEVIDSKSRRWDLLLIGTDYRNPIGLKKCRVSAIALVEKNQAGKVISSHIL